MTVGDNQPPSFRDVREFTDTPFECSVHGTVTEVLQFNGDTERCYCVACIETLFVDGGVQLATMVG